MRARSSAIVAVLAVLLVSPVAAEASKAKAVRAPALSSAPRAPAPLAPPNDRCETATLISCGNIVISGSTETATNDYTFVTDSLCTGHSAGGRDVVYRMDVQVGDSLWIDYSAVADGSIYLVRDCNNIEGTCVKGADLWSAPREVESLRYKFTVAGTYYLILDSFGEDTYGDWSAVGQLLCGPNSPPHNDLCQAALPLRCGNIFLSGSTEFAGNDYTFPTALSSCTGQVADGRDVVYKVTVVPGDSIWIDYTTSSNGSIYIVADCSDIPGTCLEGVDATGVGQTEELRHRFNFSGTYFIILDSRSAGSFGNWTAVGGLVCGTPPPANDRCDFAIPVDCGPFSLGGSTTLAANDYWFPPGEGCTGFPVDGRDVVYRFDVLEGDSVYINYTLTNADGTLYIVTKCESLLTTCKIGVDVGIDNEMETLSYRFPALGTYYMILDAVDPLTGGPWTATGELICSSVSVGSEGSPLALSLRQIQPNPFSRSTTISYTVPLRSQATLRVYDLQGRTLRTLVDHEVPPGEHRVTWDGLTDDGRRIGPGVYFASLSSGGRGAVKRMIFVR